MSANNIWKVALKIKSKTLSQLITDSGSTVTAMTGNANFLAPNPLPSNPTLAEFGVLVVALDTAYKLPKGSQRTIAIRNAQIPLELKWTLLGNYVENVANLPDNVAFGDAVIASAGMEVAKKSNGFKAEALMVKNHASDPGSVLARDKRYASNTVYVWRFRKKGEVNWNMAWCGTAAKFTFENLQSVATYQFQVEHFFVDGTTTFSQILELPVL